MRLPDKYDTVFALQFEDPELAEFEVKLRRTFGLVDAAADMAQVDLQAVQEGHARPEDLGRLRVLVDEFAGALASWNLENDEGGPVPTDRETLRGMDILFVLQLVGAFMSALGESAQVDETALPVDSLPA